MGNRFTDEDKFQDKWYRNLSIKHKILWEYLICNCDIAGFFKVDYDLMTFYVGEEIKEKDLDTLKEKIEFIKDDLIFIPNFILFQQKVNSIKELNINNNCHKGILKILDKYKSKDLLPKSIKLPNIQINDFKKHKNDSSKDELLRRMMDD